MPSKIFLKLILVTLVLAVMLFFKVHVASRIKHLSKQKNLLQDSLKAEKGKLARLEYNEYQKYTSKEMIVKYAVDSLGLIMPERPFETMRVEADKIKQIKRIVNRRYD